MHRNKSTGSLPTPRPASKTGKKTPLAATSSSAADLEKELKECRAEILCLRAKFNPAEIEKYKIQTVTTEQMFQDALIKAEKDLKAYEAGISDSPLVKELREKVYTKDKELKKLKQDAKYEAEERTILKNRCISLGNELEKLKREHQVVVKELAAKKEIHLLEQGYKQHIEELREKLAASEEKLQNYTRKVPDILAKRYDAETLQKELSDVKNENAAMRKKVVDLKKRSEENESQFSDFEYGNTHLKNKLDKMDADNKSLRSTNDKLNQSVAKLEAQLTSLQSCGAQHSSDTRTQISKLESALRSTEQETEELRAEVRKLADQLKQANANCKSAREAKANVETDLSTLQEEAERLRNTMAEQSEIINQRDVEMDKLQERLSQAEASDMYRSADGRISGTDQDLNRLKKEYQELEEKLKAEKEAHIKTNNVKDELEMKCHDAFEKISQKEKKLTQQEANHKQLIDRKDSTIQELRRERTIVDPYANSKPDQKTLEAAHKQTLNQVEELRKENNDLKSRLSKVMGSHLLDNNSNIADLSDPHSPEKLVETFSQIYDNEWTDMLECCEIELGSTKDSVSRLFTVLTDINTFCQVYSVKLTKNIFDTLHGLSSSKERFDVASIPPVRLQKLRELTKWFAPDLTETVVKEYQKNNKTVLPRKDVAELYIHRCVEVCWLMCVQTPPVVLETNQSPGPFDETVYRPYTKTGKSVDYVVWPPVRLHDKGRLICKGIAQAQGK